MKRILFVTTRNPYSGRYSGDVIRSLKIIEAIHVAKSGKEGEILENDLTIACKENAIRVLKVQKEGKKVLDIKDFLAGYKLKKGEILI